MGGTVRSAAIPRSHPRAVGIPGFRAGLMAGFPPRASTQRRFPAHHARTGIPHLDMTPVQQDRAVGHRRARDRRRSSIVIGGEASAARTSGIDTTPARDRPSASNGNGNCVPRVVRARRRVATAGQVSSTRTRSVIDMKMLRFSRREQGTPAPAGRGERANSAPDHRGRPPITVSSGGTPTRPHARHPQPREYQPPSSPTDAAPPLPHAPYSPSLTSPRAESPCYHEP